MMNKFFITFGVDHPLADKYCLIKAKDRDAARHGVDKYFGRKWAMMYSHDRLKEQEVLFDIRPLPKVIVVDEWDSVYTEKMEAA